MFMVTLTIRKMTHAVIATDHAVIFFSSQAKVAEVAQQLAAKTVHACTSRFRGGGG